MVTPEFNEAQIKIIMRKYMPEDTHAEEIPDDATLHSLKLDSMGIYSLLTEVWRALQMRFGCQSNDDEDVVHLLSLTVAKFIDRVRVQFNAQWSHTDEAKNF